MDFSAPPREPAGAAKGAFQCPLASNALRPQTGSELGGHIAGDFHADADFAGLGSGPRINFGHIFLHCDRLDPGEPCWLGEARFPFKSGFDFSNFP